MGLFLIWSFLGTEPLALATETRTIRMRWSDAGELVRGRQVTVKTNAGVRSKGIVRAVGPDSLEIANSGARIARAEIAEIRLTEYVGNGRRFGMRIGGAAGLLGGVVGAVRIGMNETSTHQQRDKVLAGILAVGGLPAGLLTGYLLGRRADREVTIIRIVPE